MELSTAHESPRPSTKPNPLKKWIRTYLVERELWRLPKTSDVLDLCCGHGFYFSINPNAVGVDANPVAVQELKNKGFNVSVCNVLQGLKFADKSFGYVVAHDVLEHFEYHELEILMKEVHRILKPNGQFLVFVPNRKGYDFGLNNEAGHKLFVTHREMESLCQNLFQIKKHYPAPLPRVIGQYFVHNKEVFELIKK